MAYNDGTSEILHTIERNKQRTVGEIKQISEALDKDYLNVDLIIEQLIERKILDENDKLVLQEKGLISPDIDIDFEQEANIMNNNENFDLEQEDDGR